MELEGHADVSRAREEVFDHLLDPEFLKRCIPGCESMEEISEARYETTVKAGVGPIKGRFKSIVSLTDVERPERYRLTIEGKSPVGHVSGEARLSLEGMNPGTRISYRGEARVSGRIASLGGRLVDFAARKVVSQFFDRMTRELAETG